jgi:lauroyl/myristoyl acyltransferase
LVLTKGVLKLQRAFKDKQLIAILPDQYPGESSRKESSKAFCFLSFNSLYIKVVGLCSDTTRAAISQQPAFKDKQLIAILPDQYPGEKGSVVSPFFGQNAQTMTLLVKLARKNNAKVLMTYR